jgi:hypothetical protein
MMLEEQPLAVETLIRVMLGDEQAQFDRMLALLPPQQPLPAALQQFRDNPASWPSHARPFTTALILVLAQPLEELNVGQNALLVMAGSLVRSAIAGDVTAQRMIGERLPAMTQFDPRLSTLLTVLVQPMHQQFAREEAGAEVRKTENRLRRARAKLANLEAAPDA